jgi:para-nitrobenzyl esterase
MIRTVMLTTMLAIAAPVMATDAPAPVAAATAVKFSTADTDIGTLLDNPVTKAILEKTMPGFTTNPQIDMARSMTLKQVQSFVPDQISDAKLTAIDAELSKLNTPSK